MKSKAIIVIVIFASFLAMMQPSKSQAQDKFFLKALCGYSHAVMDNLSKELSTQGNGEELKDGYCFSVSLGRTFSKGQLSLEGNMSISLYPELHYTNPYDSFTARVTHYAYSIILHKRFLLESGSLVPSIGIGAGYGTTNLISGGGKASSVTALISGGVEYRLRENIFLHLNILYTQSFKSDRFDNPFLENLTSDAVYDSSHNVLSDRFNSLDIRCGVTVYLIKKEPEW